MNLLRDALVWIFSPERNSGSFTLIAAIGSHLLFTLVAIVIAALVALPVGWAIGHTGKGRELAVGLSGAARALPSFGVVLLLVLLLGVEHKFTAATVSFVLLAIPPLLAGAYSGVQAVSRITVDAATAIGMTPLQVLFKVEVPLSIPLLLGGLRSALIQVIATVTLAGYIGNFGLGFFIVQGIQVRDFSQILGASLVIIVLAVAVDLLVATTQRITERQVSRT